MVAPPAATGSGIKVSLNIASGTVTKVTVTAPGSNYLVGNDLTIAKADIPGSADKDVVIRLTKVPLAGRVRV